jgi:hypothetical protein
MSWQYKQQWEEHNWFPFKSQQFQDNWFLPNVRFLILLTVFELLPKTSNFTICSIFSNSGHDGLCQIIYFPHIVRYNQKLSNHISWSIDTSLAHLTGSGELLPSLGVRRTSYSAHFCNLNLTFISYSFWNIRRKVLKFDKFDEKRAITPR